MFVTHPIKSFVVYFKDLQVKPMFGLGWTEIVVIGVVAVLVFGPKKIPELGSALGKTLRGFKEELNKPGEKTSEEEGKKQE
jgi:sec-independent protein translocase protein TatA